MMLCLTLPVCNGNGNQSVLFAEFCEAVRIRRSGRPRRVRRAGLARQVHPVRRVPGDRYSHWPSAPNPSLRRTRRITY
jgi:hypothetical protein